MRLRRVIISVLILGIILGFDVANSDFPKVRKLYELKSTDFLPTLEHNFSQNRNSIYCSSFLYAWDEIRNIIKSPLEIDSLLRDLYLVNNSKTHLNTLQKKEYSVIAKVAGGLITAKASFQKALPFEDNLGADMKLKFNGKKVESFGAIGYSYIADETIQIIYYASDNDFIINLKPKDKEHEITLCLSPTIYKSMIDAVSDIERKEKIGRDEVQQSATRWKYGLNESDEVVIPKILFNLETNYSSLEKKKFKSGSTTFQVSTAWQRTAFLLDEKGAKIESEGVGEVVFAEPVQEVEGNSKPKPKKMIFNKPFFLMMKRKDTNNPYFGLWVANTELMQAKE